MDNKFLIFIIFIGLIILPVNALLLGDNAWAEFKIITSSDDSITWGWNSTLLPEVDVYLNEELKYYNYTGAAFTASGLDGGKTYTLRLERIADMYILSQNTPMTAEQKTQELIYWYALGILGLLVMFAGLGLNSPIIKFLAVVIITVGFIIITNERIFEDNDVISYWHLLIYGFELMTSVIIAYAGRGE